MTLSPLNTSAAQSVSGAFRLGDAVGTGEPVGKLLRALLVHRPSDNDFFNTLIGLTDS
jgi:hypothetical protein